MQRMYSRCHVVIVPTTSQFKEGFNKVVAEAILAGRPAVASSMCPAVAHVRDAAVVVSADDIRAYGDAIIRLCEDRKFYEEKRRACVAAQSQFYDIGHSWAAALKRVLIAVREGREPQPVSWVE